MCVWRGECNIVLIQGKSKTYMHWKIGNIQAERTDKKTGSKKSGSLSRKLNAAMKALGDFTVLSDWIKEQVDIDIENPAMRPEEHEK